MGREQRARLPLLDGVLMTDLKNILESALYAHRWGYGYSKGWPPVERAAHAKHAVEAFRLAHPELYESAQRSEPVDAQAAYDDAIRAEEREATIEECAKVITDEAEGWAAFPRTQAALQVAAGFIRALKNEKENG